MAVGRAMQMENCRVRYAVVIVVVVVVVFFFFAVFKNCTTACSVNGLRALNYRPVANFL